MKKYQVMFKIMIKKKWTDHPSHTSVNTSWRGRLVPRGWRTDGLGTERARQISIFKNAGKTWVYYVQD